MSFLKMVLNVVPFVRFSINVIYECGSILEIYRNKIEISLEFKLQTICNNTLVIQQPKRLKQDALKQLSLFFTAN